MRIKPTAPNAVAPFAKTTYAVSGGGDRPTDGNAIIKVAIAIDQGGADRLYCELRTPVATGCRMLIVGVRLIIKRPVQSAPIDPKRS